MQQLIPIIITLYKWKYIWGIQITIIYPATEEKMTSD